jgi:hypothetical protein
MNISLHGNFQFNVHLPFLMVKIKHCIEMLKGRFDGLHIQTKHNQSKVLLGIQACLSFKVVCTLKQLPSNLGHII